jgi:hypothetical protein
MLAIFIGLSLLLTSYGCSRNDTKLGEWLCPVDKETFVRLRYLVPPKPSESNQALLIRYLDEQHIKTKNPPIILLDEKKNQLMVIGTGADLDKIAFYIFPLIKHD